MLPVHTYTQVHWLSEPQPQTSHWIHRETYASTCIWQSRYLSPVCTLSVPILLDHTYTQYPPHSHTPHDHMNSGTLVYFFCVVLTDLRRLSLTPLGRPPPMMVCITNTPFQEKPSTRLSKTHEIMKMEDLIMFWTPPRVYTSPTGYLIYGSHMKYVVTSRFTLLFPLTSSILPLSKMSCGSRKGLKNIQMSFGSLKNSTTITQESL